MRIGHGFDAHRLVSGRKLVLGGVTVPHETGLDGHSDADVLLHALCDALLGAAGLGDIGGMFPDQDDAFKGISSMVLLEQVIVRIQSAHLAISNIDATIIAQSPKLAGFIAEMRVNIARVCAVDKSRVNVKATTTEKMGFEGRGDGMSAHAVVLLSEST